MTADTGFFGKRYYKLWLAHQGTPVLMGMFPLDAVRAMQSAWKQARRDNPQARIWTELVEVHEVHFVPNDECDCAATEHFE